MLHPSPAIIPVSRIREKAKTRLINRGAMVFVDEDSDGDRRDWHDEGVYNIYKNIPIFCRRLTKDSAASGMANIPKTNPMHIPKNMSLLVPGCDIFTLVWIEVALNASPQICSPTQPTRCVLFLYIYFLLWFSFLGGLFQ